MPVAKRSACPINLSVELLGDRWTLVVLRDLMFGNRRHFRELLNHSQEGIASNILADRLRRLVDSGMVSRTADPTHQQKAIYSLTDKAIQLVPVFAHLGAWGSRHLPVSEELSIRARLLFDGGPELWDRFMDELRKTHRVPPAPVQEPTVQQELQAAYERAAARARKSGRRKIS